MLLDGAKANMRRIRIEPQDSNYGNYEKARGLQSPVATGSLDPIRPH